MKKQLMAALMLSVSAGCATGVNNYPTTPSAQLEHHLKYARIYAREKDYPRVAHHISEAFGKDDHALGQFLRSDSEVGTALHEYLCHPGKYVESKADLIRGVKIIALAGKGASGNLDSCKGAILAYAASAPLEKIRWSLEDDIADFDSLLTKERHREIVSYTLEQYANTKKYNEGAIVFESYIRKLQGKKRQDESKVALDAIQDWLCSSANQVSDVTSATSLMHGIDRIKQVSRSKRLDECSDRLNAWVASVPTTGRSFTLLDDVGAFEVLNTEQSRNKAVENTFLLLFDKVKGEAAVNALLRYCDARSGDAKAMKFVSGQLARTELPPRTLKRFSKYFPAEVESKLKKIRFGADHQGGSGAVNVDLTAMLEGCSSISDRKKKTDCFESVMALRQQSSNIGSASNAPYAKFDAINRAAAALRGATEVGVTYNQYLPLVQQLATEIQIVRAMKNSTYEVEALLLFDQAVEAYMDAYAFWKEWIHFYAQRNNEISYAGGLPIGQANIGWIVNKYSIPTTNADWLGIWRGVPKSTALTTIWRKADSYVTSANEAI